MWVSCLRITETWNLPHPGKTNNIPTGLRFRIRGLRCSLYDVAWVFPAGVLPFMNKKISIWGGWWLWFPPMLDLWFWAGRFLVPQPQQPKPWNRKPWKSSLEACSEEWVQETPADFACRLASGLEPGPSNIDSSFQQVSDSSLQGRRQYPLIQEYTLSYSRIPYHLVKEYTLNYSKIHNITYGIFLNLGDFGRSRNF